MANLTYIPIQDGEQANNQLFNARFLALHNLVNGGLDANNIADSAIGTAELSDKAVTAAKLSDQQTFIAPTLINGWVNFDPVNHATAGYMKDHLGFVHLKGIIKNGTVNLNAYILPVGFRPVAAEHFAVASNGHFGAIRIDQADGSVLIQGGAENPWVSMAGITFKAA